MKMKMRVFILFLATGFGQASMFAQAKKSIVIDLAKIGSGMVVCEVGAGSGRYIFELAEKVGPSGKVYANDIEDKGKLDVIRQQAQDRGLQNIVTVLGTETDPLLPKNTMDAVLIIDAFHDFTNKAEMLLKIAPSLKKGGKLIILDDEIDQENTTARHNTLSREHFLAIIEESPFRVDKIDDTTLPVLNCSTKIVMYFLSLKDKKSNE